ncbi:MAG: hypothetical protein U0838_16735 [Chloroflexota bacterium]
MAGTVVAVAPIVLVFLLLQRRFIEGAHGQGREGWRMSASVDRYGEEILGR